MAPIILAQHVSTFELSPKSTQNKWNITKHMFQVCDVSIEQKFKQTILHGVIVFHKF